MYQHIASEPRLNKNITTEIASQQPHSCIIHTLNCQGKPQLVSCHVDSLRPDLSRQLVQNLQNRGPIHRES